MSKLSDLEINIRMAELSGMKVVSGDTLNTPDPDHCYVELEINGVKALQQFNVLDGTSLVEQIICMNELSVSWNEHGHVTVSLPERIDAIDFVSYTSCEGNLPKAAALLVLNAAGLDGGSQPAAQPSMRLH